MSDADLLSNVEREPGDRPPRVDPVVPDLIPEERPWHGPASLHAAYWRERAERAEAAVERLARALSRYRVVP